MADSSARSRRARVCTGSPFSFAGACAKVAVTTTEGSFVSNTDSESLPASLELASEKGLPELRFLRLAGEP